METIQANAIDQRKTLVQIQQLIEQLNENLAGMGMAILSTLISLLTSIGLSLVSLIKTLWDSIKWLGSTIGTFFKQIWFAQMAVRSDQLFKDSFRGEK